jgi:muconolactone delta-isomerase
MAIVVIGGQSRNIGKTSVVCALISAMPERRWTAIKITQCKHDATTSEPCDCQFAGQPTAVSEEVDAATATDSSRYLAAGAVRSLWVRVGKGQLAEAMPRIRAEIATAENVVIESTSVLGFLTPDVYASVLNPQVADFKSSALCYLNRADAILVAGSAVEQPGWSENAFRLIEGLPKFRIAPPDYSSIEFASFVAERLAKAGAT